MAVVDEIFAHARATPDRGALTYLDRTYSYRDLAAWVVVARAEIEREAIDRHQIAVVFTADLAWAWIVGLALRSLGVTTAPGRLTKDLDDLGLGVVTVVVRAGENWAQLAEFATQRQCRVVVLPRFDNAAEVASVPPEAMRREPGAATGSYVLLTSATTGVYKKVLVDPEYEPEEVIDRVAQFPEIRRDSVINMLNFGAWTAIGYFLPMIVWRLGARLVLDNTVSVWKTLLARDLTLTYVQPALLTSILSASVGIDLRNDSMTLVVTAGAVPETLWRAARTRLTSDIRTALGSTEAGIGAVTRIETPEDLTWHRLRGPGFMEVVDDDGKPAPVGQIGQVRARLNPRVDHYLGDPDASKAFFRDGYFYPGDLAIIREDGRLSLQGRVTDVINVMGNKHGTLAMEVRLQARLGVPAVHIFSHPSEDGEEVHVVIESRDPVPMAALTTALEAVLPKIGQVRAHRVDSMPRNNMGKVERALLKAQLGILPRA